jgi:hypothetical protein
VLRFSVLRHSVFIFSTFSFFLRCLAPFPALCCSIFFSPQPLLICLSHSL